MVLRSIRRLASCGVIVLPISKTDLTRSPLRRLSAALFDRATPGLFDQQRGTGHPTWSFMHSTFASPIVPERAIRPLPESRSRSKLSPKQASSIIYPSDPPPMSPALNLGGQEIASTANSKGRMTNGDVAHGHYLRHHLEAPNHRHCTCGGEGDRG